MDLPEISQQPEGHLDFYLDELALPVPELAALTHYMISEAEGKKLLNETLIMKIFSRKSNSKIYMIISKTCRYV